MKEIGSEFWTTPAQSTDAPVWEKYSGEKRFFLSGRTALHAVIREILQSKPCKHAYLPCYCCDSMVAPFLQEGLKVSFYEVSIADGLILQPDPDFSCDIVLTADYFGFTNRVSSVPVNALHIHDVTHSLLSSPACLTADYYIGSLRKWGSVAGAGFACKTTGTFTTPFFTAENEAYTQLRYQGYALKERFMIADEGDKQVFLSLFGKAEKLLDNDYMGYAADKFSLQIAAGLSAYAAARKQNAACLIQALKSSRLVQLLWKSLGPNDVPLFVPVLVVKGYRDALRSFLIKNQVYCPVHWPMHNGQSGILYEQELSLICDQRYTTIDMQRIIDLIQEFEERCNL